MNYRTNTTISDRRQYFRLGKSAITYETDLRGSERADKKRGEEF